MDVFVIGGRLELQRAEAFAQELLLRDGQGVRGLVRSHFEDFYFYLQGGLEGMGSWKKEEEKRVKEQDEEGAGCLIVHAE